MLSALGLALFAAIQPLGVVAFIGLLGSRGGRRSARGFLVGWVLCAVVVAVLTVVVHDASRDGGVATAIGSAGLVQVALGVAALVVLVVRRRRGPRAATDVEERALGPVGAAAIAVMLQGWPVVAAAVAAVIGATAAGLGRVLGIAVVVALSSSTYVAAYVLSGARPERTSVWLARVRGVIETHRDRVVDLVLLAAGVWLVGHGLVVRLTA